MNLKPCPFCGGNDLKIHISCRRDYQGNPIVNSPYWYVSCRDGDCFICGPSSDKSQEDAIEKWNKRGDDE